MTERARIAIAIHGGAGRMPRTSGREPDVRAALARAVEAAHALLSGGAPALDAVGVAVAMLEDDPLFNAGRGSVLAEDGSVEMDASLMRGSDRHAGAVAAVRGVRNPVRAARAVLDDGRQVLLVGGAALAFAESHGLEVRPVEWFVTDRQRRRHERARGDVASPGTVGAVALDADGGLAAATSTGGRSAQRAGRVGDSALIGAGTWADDATAAVSLTGDGEAIVRAAASHQVDAVMRHRGMALEEACGEALAAVHAVGGSAGLIALDGAGNVALPFSTEAMNRGWRAGDGPVRTAVGPD